MGIFKQTSEQTARRRPQTPHANKSTYSYSSRRSTRTEPLNRQPEPSKDDSKPKRAQQPFFKNIPLLIMLFFGLIFVGYISILSPEVKIVNKGNSLKLRENSVYQAEATSFIKASAVNRSKLMFDSQGLSNHLRQKFPELASVVIDLPIIGNQPTVSLQVARPSFILSSANEAYLISENGVALLNIRDVDNLSSFSLRTVDDASGVAVETGKAVLPREQALFIATVVEQLEGQNRQISSMTIPASPYDLHIRLKDTRYFIKFNIMEDPKQQTGSFIALQERLKSKNIMPNEYIDVRAGERVFYK